MCRESPDRGEELLLPWPHGLHHGLHQGISRGDVGHLGPGSRDDRAAYGCMMLYDSCNLLYGLLPKYAKITILTSGILEIDDEQVNNFYSAMYCSTRFSENRVSARLSACESLPLRRRRHRWRSHCPAGL